MYCKQCLKDKLSSEFYASNKTRCKECIKASVRQNRLENIEHYRAFDRKRSKNPDRVAARTAYQKTIEGKIAHARATEKWRVSNAIRKNATTKVRRALLSGEIQKHPCFVCGDANSHGHHPDYDRPLSVVWLCAKHHKEAHKIAANDAYYKGEKSTLHF